MIDAHCHLADPALYPQAEEHIADARRVGVTSAVVNGTCPDDWPRVLDLATRFPDFVISSLGLHPWRVNDAPSGWLETLTELVIANPNTHIGECGVDRWIVGHDLPRQIDALLPQIDLAVRYDRALTLHCLQAWGALLDTLSLTVLPTRGFLVHAFNGSYDTAIRLLDLGAYFSFSTYFLHERKAVLRETYARLPPERLLIETDAPHMAPPGRETNTLKNLPLAAQALQTLHPGHPLNPPPFL